MNEERIRDAISRLTKARFEVSDPGSYPVARSDLQWFIWCPEVVEMKEIPHVNAIWTDKEDNLFLESMPIGNTSAWIEELYGEAGVRKTLTMDLSGFDNLDSRQKFVEVLPLLRDRLDNHERVVSEMSSKWGVNLRIRYFGRKGIATGRLRAFITAPNTDAEIANKLEVAVGALKDAFTAIDEYEGKRSNMRKMGRAREV
jgi:hypothetical protein